MSHEQPPSSAAEGDMGPEHYRQIAARLRTQLSEISRSIQVPLESLSGEVRSIALIDAERYARVHQEEKRAAAQALVVDARLRDHDQQALAKERPEPETLREWVAILTSGRVALALTSGVGALSMRLLQIGLIASLLGLSVQAAGTLALIDRSMTFELGLLAKSNDAELSRAIHSSLSEKAVPACESTPSACADDATTSAHLQTQFRAGAAYALQHELGSAARASADRAAFDLGAVRARQAILATAERLAAPSLDPGAEGQVFRSSSPPHAANTAEVDILDQAFRRRVDSLRAHESTWTRLRGWAAQQVPLDYASEAFLRTALGDIDGPTRHALHTWSEQASFHFVQDLIHSGDPTAAAHALASRRVEMPSHVGTERDKRLFRDFSAGVPERVGAEFAAYNASGRDPGSLQRTLANSGEHAPSSYGELFPGSSSGAGASPSENKPVTKPSATESKAAVAAAERSGAKVAQARSYSRVRFSAKIGGVVFGRPAEPGGTSPDVVDLRWDVLATNAITLVVRMRDGDTVRLGPYHPAVVHHALAFVADGRVVVVTLPQPQLGPERGLQIPARRVVVHPAFEDTAFACSPIQIDRFVDTFTRDPYNGMRSDRLGRIALARSGVSNLGVLLGADESVAQKESDELLPGIRRHLLNCVGDAQCFPIKRYEEMGVQFGSVDQFLACLRDKESPSEQRACLSGLQRGRDRNGYLVDSGVREKPYKIDAKLDFVSGTAHRNDRTWPIEFMIQAVPQVDESNLNINANQDPWQFPTIAADVQAAVAQGLDSSRAAQDVFRNVRDFVALQRLFRAALSGELGRTFPLHALVRLSADTKGAVRVQRNERWNVSNSFFEFGLRVQDFVLGKLPDAKLQKGGRCRKRIDEILATSDQPRSGIFDFWRSFAKIDGDCAGEPALRDLISLQRQLRQQDFISQMLELEHTNDAPKRDQLYCAAL